MAGKNKDASLNKRAFTSGFFFILAQLFARGLTFAVTPIYSRLLTQAQYGIVRTYESWLLIAYTVMSLCLWRSVDVAKNDFEEDYNGYVSSVHTLSYIAIAFFFGICMIFKTQVQDFCQMDDLMFYSCFLYVFQLYKYARCTAREINRFLNISLVRWQPCLQLCREPFFQSGLFTEAGCRDSLISLLTGV